MDFTFNEGYISSLILKLECHDNWYGFYVRISMHCINLPTNC